MSECSEDDIKDLWSAVNALRTAVSELTAVVREVRVMLSERCEARAKSLDDLNLRMKGAEKKIWLASGGVAVIAFIGGIIAKLR